DRCKAESRREATFRRRTIDSEPAYSATREGAGDRTIYSTPRVKINTVLLKVRWRREPPDQKYTARGILMHSRR
ncbi:hypothetical protein LSAT2_021068, partial [Lamellibrachia satsuma]